MDIKEKISLFPDSAGVYLGTVAKGMAGSALEM